MKGTGFLCIALTAAVAIGCNSTDRRDTAGSKPGDAVGTAGSNDNISRGDRDFVHDIGIANMAEIELGRMATERAASPEVKKFGQMMMDDHTKAGDELKAVATRHNIPLPTALDDKHVDLRDKLQKLNGADFDREYMKAMVDGHDGVLDKLGSRVDSKTLGEWKTTFVNRTAGNKMNEVKEQGETKAILPEKSDNPVTMAINEWAAASYPVVYSHHEKAENIDKDLKKRTTN
jgi:putative membrane protein